MANLEIRQERVQRGEACGVARRRGIDIGNSFLGGSELGENLLGDLGQRKKKEKKQTPPRYGNYKGRRYLILAVKEGAGDHSTSGRFADAHGRPGRPGGRIQRPGVEKGAGLLRLPPALERLRSRREGSPRYTLRPG